MKYQRVALALLASFIFLGASQCSDEKTVPAAADDMINAFSQACNLGPWSRASLERAGSLAAVFESIRQRGTCKDDSGNVANALYAAQSLQAELRAVDADNVWRKERQMEEASNDLLLTLSTPGLDPNAQAALAGSYSSARMELSMARADASFLNNPGGKYRFTTGMERVSSHIRDLMAASQGLSACYRDNPSVALQLGAGMAEMAGSFMSPAVGLGVSAVSGLMKLGIDAVRTYPAADAIYKVRKGTMPIALSCGLEAFTRDYCKAKDARKLMAVAVRDQGEVLPFFRGLELQDRHLPVLYTWLDRVVNGSDDIRDPDHADRLNGQYSRINSSQNSKRYAQGYFQKASVQIGRTTAPDVKIAIIKGVMRNLVALYFNCGINGETACDRTLFTGFENAVGFVKAVAKERLPNPYGNYQTVQNLIEALDIRAEDLPFLQNNFYLLFQSRYQEVVREFNEKVNVNLASLMRDASRRDTQGRSPLRAIEATFKFLEDYRFPKNETDKKRDEVLIEELRDRLNSVYQALLDPNSISDRRPEVPCSPGENQRAHCFDLSPAAKTLAIVFEAFKLENNNVFLPGSMQGLVAADLVTRYEQNEGPRELTDILKLAGVDLLQTLHRFNLTPSQVELDLSRSQAVSDSSLKEFRSYFDPAIKMAMVDLKANADSRGEPESGRPEAPNRNVLAQLCLLTLISDQEWPKDIDIAVCRGTKVVSHEANLTLDFDELEKNLKSHTFDDRVCIYEEFLRTDRIANLDLALPQKEPNSLWQRLVDLLEFQFSP
jgi:hypothetical protein